MKTMGSDQINFDARFNDRVLKTMERAIFRYNSKCQPFEFYTRTQWTRWRTKLDMWTVPEHTTGRLTTGRLLEQTDKRDERVLFELQTRLGQVAESGSNQIVCVYRLISKCNNRLDVD